MLWTMMLSKFSKALFTDASQKFGTNPIDYLYVLRTLATIWNYATFFYLTFHSTEDLLDLLRVGRRMEGVNQTTGVRRWEFGGRLKKLCSNSTVYAIILYTFIFRVVWEVPLHQIPERANQLFPTRSYDTLVDFITNASCSGGWETLLSCLT